MRFSTKFGVENFKESIHLHVEDATMVKAPFPLPMDLDLRFEARDEEGLQQVRADESLELFGLVPERLEAMMRIETKMSPS